MSSDRPHQQPAPANPPAQLGEADSPPLPQHDYVNLSGREDDIPLSLAMRTDDMLLLHRHSPRHFLLTSVDSPPTVGILHRGHRAQARTTLPAMLPRPHTQHQMTTRKNLATTRPMPPSINGCQRQFHRITCTSAGCLRPAMARSREMSTDVNSIPCQQHPAARSHRTIAPTQRHVRLSTDVYRSGIRHKKPTPAFCSGAFCGGAFCGGAGCRLLDEPTQRSP